MTPWALLSFITSLAKGAHKYGLDSVSILENLKALPQLVFILTLFQTDKLDAAELTEMTDFTFLSKYESLCQNIHLHIYLS